MKIEVTNPIDHSGHIFERGIHEVSDEEGAILLMYTWAARPVRAIEAPAPEPAPRVQTTEAVKAAAAKGRGKGKG